MQEQWTLNRRVQDSKRGVAGIVVQEYSVCPDRPMVILWDNGSASSLWPYQADQELTAA